jgi:hypothetical protein
VTHQFFLGCPTRSLCALLGHSVLVHESSESCTLLGGAFCVALLNMEFVPNCKLAARIDLRGLRWNASLMRLTFSSEVHVFQEILYATLPIVLSLLSQNRMLFPVGGWRPYILRTKMTLDSRKRLELC